MEGAGGEAASYTASPVSLEVGPPYHRDTMTPLHYVMCMYYKYYSNLSTPQVGLETVREEQLSLLLSDGAVRRLIRGGDRLHYKVEIEDTV